MMAEAPQLDSEELDSLRGQMVGFINIISKLLLAFVIPLYHELDKKDYKELLKQANQGIAFDEEDYFKYLDLKERFEEIGMAEITRVFLDSSDYSVLSDPPNKQRSAITNMLPVLLNLKDSGRVRFYYSGTILSEMSPLDSAYISAAERRIDILIRLCATNALIWHNTILTKELASAYKATDPTSEIDSVYSDTGDWYPLDILRLLPNDRSDLDESIIKKLRNSGLSRDERRKTQNQLFKHGRLKPTIRTALYKDSNAESTDEFLARFPVCPEDARILMDFYLDRASADEATSAFRASLRNPRWMIQWLHQHQAESTEFIALMRTPAATAVAAILPIFEAAREIRTRDNTLNTGFADSIITNKKWTELQNSVLSSVAAQLAELMLGVQSRPLDPKTIELQCPGLTVAIRSLFSAWWTTTTKMPRTPQPNDFADAIHAIYAPYVHIFRADSFMAPHIQKHAAQYNVKVVSKLPEISEAVSAIIKTQNRNLRKY